jgi:DUF2075 family protein
MIVYKGTKLDFTEDVLTGDIDSIIEKKFFEKLKRAVPKNELKSWHNSMTFMNTVLMDPYIPNDCGVSIECQIPQTSKRIDFILTGQSEKQEEYAIIIELKQWDKIQLTDKDAVVKTRFQHGLVETSHPSYQAWSYANMIENFNQTVYEENIQLKPCAYLHNYTSDGLIDNPFYAEHIERAPLFLKQDTIKLRDFIKQFVKHGDSKDILFRIDNGKIKPSKMLSDSLANMMKGNKEFIMIDDQKVVYETALQLSKKAETGKKQVYIVEGGPGTGKSVLAINLLVELTKRQKNTQYVTKNAAPRAVYEEKLTGTIRRTQISNFFKGSGAYHSTPENTFDALVIDEAHRLNEKSGMYSNLGENQVKEIIRASRFSIFFIDENQRVTLKDIGTKAEIEQWANQMQAEVNYGQLESQFRCNGADGYLAWLDYILYGKETANTDLLGIDYDFKVMNSPAEVRDIIFEKNKINNRARMVAGYCYDWKSKKDPNAIDISFPQYGFHHKWNLSVDGSKWIISPKSVNEVGCIHTCQGLEVDYIGVIIGRDLIYRDEQVLVDPKARSKQDSSIKGYKTLLEKSPNEAREIIRLIIKNTYRTLMTRGMKGCYIWCEDEGLNEYLKKCNID